MDHKALTTATLNRLDRLAGWPAISLNRSQISKKLEFVLVKRCTRYGSAVRWFPFERLLPDWSCPYRSPADCAAWNVSSRASSVHRWTKFLENKELSCRYSLHMLTFNLFCSPNGCWGGEWNCDPITNLVWTLAGYLSVTTWWQPFNSFHF